MKSLESPWLYTVLMFYSDPLSRGSQKAMELIANSLQKQYERWQPRARYKQLLDPTTDEVRKLCIALRKNAKVGERERKRVLLYHPFVL